jgi:hypothetical protein
MPEMEHLIATVVMNNESPQKYFSITTIEAQVAS